MHDGTTIGRVRLHAEAADPTATRMRGEAALRALDLRPPGMPRQAILVIRTLRDPLPGAIDLRSPHAMRATDWERAARGAITDAWRRAGYPIRGNVPETIESVVFNDRSELLACAARETRSWWWTNILKERSEQAVVREWLRTPEYVPAALAHLAATGEAATFVHTLTDEQAIELLTRVLESHAVHTLARVITQARIAAHSITTRAPWQPHEVADDATLTTQQRLFLNLTLLLRNAPAEVRSESFARSVEMWIATPAFGGDAITTTATSQTAPASPVQRDQPTAVTPNPIRPTHNTPREDQESPARSTTPVSPKSASQLPRAATTEASQPAPAITKSPEYPTDANQHRSNIAPEQPSPDDARSEAPALIDTNYGGLLFLLNAAIALGYYDPYGRHDQLDANPWDLLTVVALTEIEDFDEDPLAQLLRDLAGRDSNDNAFPDLSHQLPTIDHQLRTSLDREDALTHVITRYARITTTPSHVDVHFQLATHPIDIRIAGLDRDPGWIPAAGRHVAFHFD